MGYKVKWGATAGPDGGIDIIAYTDILGINGQQIKAQCKKWNGRQAGRPDLQQFNGALQDTDSGIFFCTGGFSQEALNFVRHQTTKRITTIDLDEFIELWIEHFAQLTADAKIRLPLRPIYILALPE
jgi:restriction system protein